MLEDLASQVGSEWHWRRQYTSHSGEQGDSYSPVEACGVKQRKSEERPFPLDVAQECWFVAQRWNQKLGIHATI